MIYEVEILDVGCSVNKIKGNKRIVTFKHMTEAIEVASALSEAWHEGYFLALKLAKEKYSESNLQS